MKRFVLAAIAASVLCATAEAGVVHIQTDKPIYRLGDTIWYRVHLSPGESARDISLTLQHEGLVVATRAGEVKPDQPLDGSFLLPEDLPGGAYRIVAAKDGKVQHEVGFQVYDVVSKQLDVGLSVIGEMHDPGEKVIAVFSALERTGKPIEGALVKYRATFGPLEISGEAGKTDAEGRALIRFEIPERAQASGFLSAGVEHGKKIGAMAQVVLVSAGVARVDAFPEGGAVPEAGPHRFGLLVRDLNGEPSLAEGRVLDEKGAVCGLFKTDRRGLAAVEVDLKKGRAYEIAIDRPANVTTRFPLPGPSSHAHALRLELIHTKPEKDQQQPVRDDVRLGVEVRGKKTGERTEVLLVSGDRILERKTVGIPKDGEAANVVFPASEAGYELAYVILKEGDRVTGKCPVILGKRWPWTIDVKVREGQHLPGDLAAIDITAGFGGKGTATDLAVSVFNSGLAETARWTPPDLAARAFLAPYVGGTVSDVVDLFDGSEGAEARREAYLLVHGSYAFPEVGVTTASADTLPEANLGRVEAPPVPPRAKVEAEPAAQDGQTVSREAPRTPLDKLIQRAPFTRTETPRPEQGERSFGRADAEETAPPPGHGKLQTAPPQDVAVPSSKPDCRDTLYWKSRLSTDKDGHATVGFKVSSEVTPYTIVVQGFIAGKAVSQVASFKPGPNFQTAFAFPPRVSVGDRFDVLVETTITDGSKDPIELEVSFPPCLKTIGRSEAIHDPWVSAKVTKFSFEVVAPAQEAKFQVVVSRYGLWNSFCCRFREVNTRTFSAGYRDVELSFGKSGYQAGAQALAVKIPENAISGSVTASTRVVPPSPVAEAEQQMEDMLREPYGCFEQTTSTNYPNLVIMDRLVREPSPDPAVLCRASAFAQLGFDRILTFQSASGGFCLWNASGKPEVRYTAMAVVQLALFAKHFHGKGSHEIARALDWLAKNSPEDTVSGLYAMAALKEAGLEFPASEKLLAHKPRSNYELALLASAVVDWKGEWPEKKPRKERQDELLASLERAMSPSGSISSEGTGIMGSSGPTLAVETTALAAIAFRSAGKVEATDRCVEALFAMKGAKGYWSTQASALSIRALAGCVKPGNPLPIPVVVQLSGNGLSTVTASVGGERCRPLTLTRPVDARPGATLSLALDMKTPTPLEYGLSCSYRVADPESSLTAPFKIATTVPNELALGATGRLGVRLERTSAPIGSGQLCAIVAMPGGLRVDQNECCHLAASSRVEVKDGSLVLYWERAADIPASFEVPFTAATAGTFTSAPSVIYPYYESGKEAFARGLEVRVSKNGRPTDRGNDKPVMPPQPGQTGKPR